MARVIFARHGESTANLSRTFANREEAHPLTAVGTAQARDLAARLREAEVSTLLTSPLTRARQTADVVAGELGVTPLVDEALREFDVGRWEGTASAEGWAEYAVAHERWRAGDESACVGGGESLTAIRARTEELFLALAAGAGTTLCISHGGLYRTALPGRLVNVSLEFALGRPFPNAGWVVAESRDGGLWCLEWCGEEMD